MIVAVFKPGSLPDLSYKGFLIIGGGFVQPVPDQGVGLAEGVQFRPPDQFPKSPSPLLLRAQAAREANRAGYLSRSVFSRSRSSGWTMATSRLV